MCCNDDNKCLITSNNNSYWNVHNFAGYAISKLTSKIKHILTIKSKYVLPNNNTYKMCCNYTQQRMSYNSLQHYLVSRISLRRSLDLKNIKMLNHGVVTFLLF